MKKFDKVLISILCLGVAIMLVSLNNLENPQIEYSVEASEILFPDEYVFEDYIITEIENDGQEIYGGIIASTAEIDTAEGIFFDPSVYVDFPHLKELKVGDKVRVTYDSQEYAEGCWDNLLNVENID